MEKRQEMTGYELFMVALSVYVLLALSAERIFPLEARTTEILNPFHSRGDTSIFVTWVAIGKRPPDFENGNSTSAGEQPENPRAQSFTCQSVQNGTAETTEPRRSEGFFRIGDWH